MEYIYSEYPNKRLLHIVYRLKDMKEGREDLIPSDNFLQLSALNLKEGKTFKPHRHIWKDPLPRKDFPQNQIIAQESWVVISGKVEVTYYDLEGTHIVGKAILYPGDVSITIEGGHNYLMLEDSVVYEYKTGPYEGIERDKVQF